MTRDASDCDCPRRDGSIYHDRATCPDPVVALFGWYADSNWACSAYGAEALEWGARCFVAEPGKRVCASAAVCLTVMTGERQRVWKRIQEGAAAGDPTMAWLAEEFINPDTILNGEDAG